MQGQIIEVCFIQIQLHKVKRELSSRMFKALKNSDLGTVCIEHDLLRVIQLPSCGVYYLAS